MSKVKCVDGPLAGEVLESSQGIPCIEWRRFEVITTMTALTGAIGGSSVPTVTRSIYRVFEDTDDDGNKIARFVAQP